MKTRKLLNRGNCFANPTIIIYQHLASIKYLKSQIWKIHILKKLLLHEPHEKRKKSRLLVKRGVANIALLLLDIAVIYTKNNLVYVIDRDSKKYSIDKTLTELEEKLDDAIFFRANRQYIINTNFVRSFKSFQKVKLLVDIAIPELEEPVIISQQVALAFKNWMEEA